MIPRPGFAIRTALMTAPVILSVALLSPVHASDLCGEEDAWAGMFFENDLGKNVTEARPIQEEAPSGVWKIDCGENGSAKLVAWDKDEIMICAAVTAWTRSEKGHPEEILREVKVETDGGRLRSMGPAQSETARWAVSYKIYAPHKIDLDVQTHNGGVSIEGLYGRMNLHTINGPIAVRDVGGDVRGRTSNGPVSAHLTGSRWKGAGLDLETSNGPVHLSIPKRYSANLETGTENGPSEVAFPISVEGMEGARIKTVLGSGGPPVRVVTTNGPAVLARN